jgi:hypothetical protein
MGGDLLAHPCGAEESIPELERPGLSESRKKFISTGLIPGFGGTILAIIAQDAKVAAERGDTGDPREPPLARGESSVTRW